MRTVFLFIVLCTSQLSIAQYHEINNKDGVKLFAQEILVYLNSQYPEVVNGYEFKAKNTNAFGVCVDLFLIDKNNRKLESAINIINYLKTDIYIKQGMEKTLGFAEIKNIKIPTPLFTGFDVDLNAKCKPCVDAWVEDPDPTNGRTFSRLYVTNDCGYLIDINYCFSTLSMGIIQRTHTNILSVVLSHFDLPDYDPNSKVDYEWRKSAERDQIPFDLCN